MLLSPLGARNQARLYSVLTLIDSELSTIYVHSIIPRPSPSSVFGCFNRWQHYMWWYLRGLHHLQYLVASIHGTTTCDDISEAFTVFSIWLLQYMELEGSVKPIQWALAVSMTENESLPYFCHPWFSCVLQRIWLPWPGKRSKDCKPRWKICHGCY